MELRFAEQVSTTRSSARGRRTSNGSKCTQAISLLVIYGAFLTEYLWTYSCFALNCHLTDPNKEYLEMLAPGLAKKMQEEGVALAAHDGGAPARL